VGAVVTLATTVAKKKQILMEKLFILVAPQQMERKVSCILCFNRLTTF